MYYTRNIFYNADLVVAIKFLIDSRHNGSLVRNFKFIVLTSMSRERGVTTFVAVATSSNKGRMCRGIVLLFLILLSKGSGYN